MTTKTSIDQLNFSDSRLEFSSVYRFLWHLLQNTFYIALTVAVIIFIFLDISWIRWSGLFFALFLIDRAYTINKGLHSIAELNGKSLDGINVADFFEPKSFRAIEKSFDRALIVGGNFYLILLKILIKDSGIRNSLKRLEISPEEFEQKLDEEISKSAFLSGEEKLYKQNDLFVRAANLAKVSFLEAYSNKDEYVKRGDVFLALSLIGDAETKKVFSLFQIDSDDLQKALIFSKFHRKQSWVGKLPGSLGGFAHKPHQIRHRYMNRAWTSRPTPVLDKFSNDMTDMARDGQIGFLIGHEKEYDQMLGVLARPARPNVLLIGDPGSGKETLVERLAFEIINDKAPELLFDKRVVSLQISDLVSGVDFQEISKRVREVANEIVSANNVILFIPDIHNLLKSQNGSGGENYMSAADIILPILKSDTFQVIGATYPKEFKQNVEQNSDFMNAFEIVHVEEISEDEAVKVLTYESVILEREYNLVVSFKAIKQAVILAHKYFRQTLLPSSAENILREALAVATQNHDKILKEDHVITVCEKKVDVPIHKATKDEAQKLLDLENIIHKDLIGQEEAVNSVSSALREYRSGLARSSGPIAAFLFVGPTGVGKTELGKILAKTQFGSENAMIRFDMSEYQDKQSIFRFIGSPDGKISGSLTENVIQKPYSLVLLDEFEKAHPDVLNLFLQVFDDGRLTDNLGRVVDFKNTIIIATSNANSDYIKEQLEAGKEISQFKDDFKKKLASYFKPELLNRFSDIVVFKNLSEDDILKITRLQLKKLVGVLAESQGMEMEFSEDVEKYVAKIGYDPIFGARPLRAAISDRIKSVLAEKILKGEVKKGEKIKVEMEGEKVVFSI